MSRFYGSVCAYGWGRQDEQDQREIGHGRAGCIDLLFHAGMTRSRHSILTVADKNALTCYSVIVLRRVVTVHFRNVSSGT